MTTRFRYRPHPTRTLRHLALLSVAISLAFLGSVSYAQWQEPTDLPPRDNAASPLNVSALAQQKSGALTVAGLVSNSAVLINDLPTGGSPESIPAIELQDTDHNNWWIYADDHRLRFIADRNNNGDWRDDVPSRLLLYQDPAAGNDYATFANQVRANEYCDENGQNCWRPATDRISQLTGAIHLPACRSGEILEYSGGSWNCATDDTGGASLSASCSAGQALTGIDSRGRAQCVTVPPRTCERGGYTFSSGYTCMTDRRGRYPSATIEYLTCRDGSWNWGSDTGLNVSRRYESCP